MAAPISGGGGGYFVAPALLRHPRFPPLPLLSSRKCRGFSSHRGGTRRRCGAPPIANPQLRRSSLGHGLFGDAGSSSASRPRMSLAGVEPSIAVKKKAAEISLELKGTSIFLVGMKCSIKSNLGKVLADALRYYYFDSDSLVEQAAAGESAVGPFQESDEKDFLDLETEVLKQLSSLGRLVVCSGNGAVRSSTNLGLLRYGISIWIDLPLELLANEVLETEALSPSSSTREWSNSKSYLKVMDKLSQRYNELREGFGMADATISLQKVASQQGYEELGSVTLDDLAVEALKQIEKLIRVKKMMEDAAKPF